MKRVLNTPGIFRRIDEMWFGDEVADDESGEVGDVSWVYHRLDAILFRQTWHDMTDERDYIPPQAGIEGDFSFYESASGDYTEQNWERISRIRRHVEGHNYTQPFTWQQKGGGSFFYCNCDSLI
jgi:hypothetical protein